MLAHLLTTVLGWLSVVSAEPVIVEPVDDPSGPPRIEVRPDVEIDLEFVDGPDRPRRGPPDARGFRREGKNWILSGFDLVIAADEDADDEGDEEDAPAKPPIDLSKGPLKIKLEDGREAELRPSSRLRFGRRDGPPGQDGPRNPPGPPMPPGAPPMPPGPPAFAPPGGNPPAFPFASPEEQEILDKQRELERQCGRLAMRFRQSDNEESKAKTREELAKSLTKLFEFRQEMRESSLQRMKKELERLEKSIQEREEKKSTLIEQRLRQLIEDPVDF